MKTKITMGEIIPELMHGVILNGETIIPSSIELIALVREKVVNEDTGEHSVVFKARKAYSVLDDIDAKDYFTVTEIETLFEIEDGSQTTQEMASRLSHTLNIPYVDKHHIIIDIHIRFLHSKNIDGYEFKLFNVDEFAQYIQSILSK